MGFFIAGYTGVLLNTTARPFWAATDPLLGLLFIVSAGSAGAAVIALAMAARRVISGDAFEHLEQFDRLSLAAELLLIIVLILVAGEFAAPLFSGPFLLLFWIGTVLLGILVPLVLSWYASRRGLMGVGMVMLIAVLVLFGGALLRVSLVAAGQV
jgi:formate-dependent nitrite reductase membrane component NrfD